MGRNFWRQARKFRIKHFFRSRVPRYDRFGKICSTLSMTKTNSEDRNDREAYSRTRSNQKRLERNRVNAEILNGRLYLVPFPSCFFRESNRFQNRRFKTNAWNINRSTRWKLFRARISDIQVNFRGERWSSRDERYASFFKGIVIGNVRKISDGCKIRWSCRENSIAFTFRVYRS